MADGALVAIVKRVAGRHVINEQLLGRATASHVLEVSRVATTGDSPARSPR